MLGRRRHARFLLAKPFEGSVQIREDVAVEKWQEDEVIVLAPGPCRPQERLHLEFPGASRNRVTATVIESRPSVSDDGRIRHRLRLLIESGSEGTVHA